MADFLTRLAGRTLGLAPVVQPVIAPLYAPAQQLATPAYTQDMPLRGLETIDMDGADAGHLNRQAASSHENPFQSHQSQPASMPPSLVQPVDRPSLPLPAALHRVPDVQPAPAFQPLVGQEKSRGDARLIEPHPLQSAPLTGQALSPTRQSHLIASDILEGASSPDQRPRPTLRIQSSAPPVSRASLFSFTSLIAGRGEHQPERLSQEEVDTITAEEAPPSLYAQQPGDSIEAAAGVAFPRFRSRTEQLAVSQREQPSELSASTPAIQVTIGRIEVRAAPPPAAHPRRQRSGPPVMGLEEYLTRRAKEGY